MGHWLSEIVKASGTAKRQVERLARYNSWALESKDRIEFTGTVIRTSNLTAQKLEFLTKK